MGSSLMVSTERVARFKQNVKPNYIKNAQKLNLAQKMLPMMLLFKLIHLFIYPDFLFDGINMMAYCCSQHSYSKKHYDLNHCNISNSPTAAEI